MSLEQHRALHLVVRVLISKLDTNHSRCHHEHAQARGLSFRSLQIKARHVAFQRRCPHGGYPVVRRSVAIENPAIVRHVGGERIHLRERRRWETCQNCEDHRYPYEGAGTMKQTIIQALFRHAALFQVFGFQVSGT